jgi:hypothetical protein
MTDERESSEALTHLMKMTGANNINELEDKVFMATKTFLGMGKIFRRNVPAKFKGFHAREIDGKRVQCTIVEYHDGVQFALPVGQLFKGFEIIKDPDDITTTFIRKADLEKGM